MTEIASGNVIVVGAGGFGREVYQWARASLDRSRFRLSGFLTRQPSELEGYDVGCPVLGNEDTYAIRDDDYFLVGIGRIEIRKRVVTQLKTRGARFLSLIHPTAILAPTAKLGEGVVLCPFVTVSDHVTVGDFSLLNLYASCGHDASIGKYCTLSPYAIATGFAVLDDEVFVGSNATVAPSVKVGKRVTVSANTAVLRNVPDGQWVVGVPGRILPSE